MIFPLGSVVNALAIVIGAVVGLLLHGRLPENMRRIVFQGLGLCVVVIGMQMMGSLLITSLIVFPAITAMRLFKSFRSVIIASAGISVVCFLIGMVISYQYNTPTGASVVIVNLAALGLFQLIRLGLRYEK